MVPVEGSPSALKPQKSSPLGSLKGEQDPARLAAMADPGLRASAEQLQDALRAAATVQPLHPQILGLFWVRLELVESHMEILEKSFGQALHLQGVPGFGVDSSAQVIAEVGPTAATFASAPELCSWVGVCPGHE
jgi:transposase